MSFEPDDYVLPTVLVTYAHITGPVTQAAAGTVTFTLLDPDILTTADGITITVADTVGYLGEDGTLRRDSRVGEQGVPLVCNDPDYNSTGLRYRARFDLTDLTGRWRITRPPIEFTVDTTDVDLTRR